MDETSQKIIDATMTLVRENGYVATTTKDIAKLAGVNECTLFRKFKTKKDIVLSGVEQLKWRADISPAMFDEFVWDLKTDLKMIMTTYMKQVTSDFVGLSIGLRAPQIYEETAPFIMQVPQTFVSTLSYYFEQMHQRGKIVNNDYESLAMTIFSATFGYTFLQASFADKLTQVEQQRYIENSIDLFINGLNQGN